MPIDYLAHLRADSARFAAVLRDADPSAPVPSCPDWTAADLLWHLTEVNLLWGVVVRERLDDPGPSERAKPPRATDYDELLSKFDAASRQLIAVLEATPDETPVWTWSDDHSVAFVRRRMAHEALIHRLDAELTVDQVSDLDPQLAADGVHEAFERFYGGLTPPWATFDPSGPVGRIAATDTGDDILLQVGTITGTHSPGHSYTDEPSVLLLGSGEPSFTLRASARDLMAWLWNRPTLHDLEVDGNRDDFAKLHAVVDDPI